MKSLTLRSRIQRRLGGGHALPGDQDALPSSVKPALTPPVEIRCLQEPGREVVREEDKKAQYRRE